MKRANKTGTVYKLGGNRRNPWIAKIPNGYDDEGNRRWIIVGYFPTKKEASIALADHIVAPLSEKSKLKFSELYKEFSPHYLKNLAKSTVDNVRNSYKLSAPLHDYKFKDIRAAQLQKVMDSVVQGRATKEKLRQFWKAMYKYALKNDITNKNYADFVTIEKEKTKKKKNIFTDLDIEKLFNEKNDPAAEMTLMLIYSGFRIQEMLNLTVFDVDFSNKTINGGSKTEAGRDRTVPIHQKTFYLWKKWTSAAQDRIFVRNNQIITADYFRKKMLYPLLEKLGIEKKTPHDARHTCATLMARAGVSEIAIKEILGHTDYAFTANRYTHPQTDTLVAEMNKM